MIINIMAIIIILIIIVLTIIVFICAFIIQEHKEKLPMIETESVKSLLKEYQGWKRIYINRMPFTIIDIHPGHGGDEIHPLKFPEEDVDKVMQLIQELELPTKINWKIISNLSDNHKFRYMYDKEF